MGFRARGANAGIYGAINGGVYGAKLSSGFRALPVVSADPGDEQNLLNDALLGRGREPQDAGMDVINNEGQIVVPVDLRNFGFWLRLLLGDPTTAQGTYASGNAVFGSQPANNATLTLDGVDVTFVTSGADPADHEVNIGATLAETLANLVGLLNASADTDVSAARYAVALDGVTVTIIHRTAGTGGNAFTLARSTSPASNITLSGATLTGGAATGPYNHVFTAGKQDHPDANVEIFNPEVPRSGLNYGLMIDSLSIQGQRSGLLNATLQAIAQGEAKATSRQSGTLETAWAIKRFSQFSGYVEADGVPLARVESFNLRINNNLDKDESIRSDGRIGGADPGALDLSLEVTVRFDSTTLQDKATSGIPLSVRLGWSISPTETLDFVMERVRLPLRKVGLSGPGGIRQTLPCLPVENEATNRALYAVLRNDVAAY